MEESKVEYNEKKRQERKRDQILRVLKEKGLAGVTNAELSATVSLRYGAHLGSLYQLGYKINKESLGEGLFRYTLVGEPSEDFTGKQKAMDALKSALTKEGNAFIIPQLEEIMNTIGIAVRYKGGTHNA